MGDTGFLGSSQLASAIKKGKIGKGDKRNQSQAAERQL